MISKSIFIDNFELSINIEENKLPVSVKQEPIYYSTNPVSTNAIFT
jgi:hypothetical protein